MVTKERTSPCRFVCVLPQAVSSPTHRKCKPVVGNKHARMEKLLRKSYGLVVSQETAASKDKQKEMTDGQMLGCLMVFTLK